MGWTRVVPLGLAAAVGLAFAACDDPPRTAGSDAPAGPEAAAIVEEAFLDTVQERTFDWFWETTNPRNGLTPDREPDPPFSSIAAVGDALTAYPIGVERGWVSREDARDRTLTTLRFFWELPQGPDSTEVGGHRGFFYHFLDMVTGLRHVPTELSTIDTTILLAGILFAAGYFDGDHPDEADIRALADSLYRRVDWQWAQDGELTPRMGWRPGEGYGPARWEGYNEAMLLYVLALGSPTHPLPAESWDAWTSTYEWDEFQGLEFVQFAPLFGHQYSHMWIDFRGIRDDYMRERGIDYFENSRRATLAQRAYATENPMGWKGYDAEVWGLTASDGPAGVARQVDGEERRFHRYWARGAAAGDIRDDGTIAPTAAGGSVPFAPEIAVPALKEMRERYGDDLFTEYGFLDAFNPTFTFTDVELVRGRVDPERGWFAANYLGIDQGPIIVMIENYRSGLVWDVMKESPHVVRGLCRAGFTGGWLEGRCE
ncbi:MAG: glucoamylase family protein [Gemmatimonadota bacterium]